MRGNGAYDHIKVLREMEFVTSERKGRSRLLKLTPKFFEYFDIVEQEMKEKFHDVGDKQEQAVAKKVEVSQEVFEETPEEVVEEVKEETKEVEEEKEEEKEEGEEALAIENAPQEAVIKLDADDFGSVL
jgi:gas vesicle protein